MNGDDYPHLRDLLASAFYQGWKERGDTAELRLEAIARRTASATREAISSELDALLARRLGPEELERVLVDELRCYHVPRERDGGPARWLQQVRRVIQRQGDASRL